MITLSAPACPRCIDGGEVELIDVPNEAQSVFYPLPKGEELAKHEFRCAVCGWTQTAPVEKAQEASAFSQRQSHQLRRA